MAKSKSRPRGHVEVPRAVTSRDDVSAPAMLVYGSVATLTKLRKAPPSAGQVAEHLGWDVRNVQRHLVALAELALVEAVANPSDRRIPRYQVRDTSVAEVSDGSVAETGGSSATHRVEVRDTSVAHLGEQASLPGVEIPSGRDPRERGSDPVVAIFELWQEQSGKARAKLDEKRRTKIRRALDAYGRETVEAAIRGCCSSDWHRREGHLDLGLILRDAEHVEKYAEMHARGPRPGLASSRAPMPAPADASEFRDERVNW